MTIILSLYVLANVLIIYYFFIYKNNQADKEYNEQLRRIRHSNQYSTGKKDSLWKITQSNMNMDMFNVMDQIRLEQIQELNEAMGMWLIWKKEKEAHT